MFKVLYLIDSMGVGGAERHLVQVARFLAGRGVKQKIIQVYNEENFLRPELNELGIEIRNLGDRKGIGALAPGFLPLVKHCRDWNPDIICTQLVVPDILGRSVGKVVGIPVVSIWQNLTYDRINWTARNRPHPILWGLRLLDRLTARFGARFIAVSRAVELSHREAFGLSGDLCEVIPNSVDVNRFPDNGAKARKKAGRLRLIHIGRHVPHKGIDTLLRALALVPPEFDIQVDSYGEGPLTQELEEQAQVLGVHSRFRFRGLKEDLVPDMLEADAAIFPSYREGLSLAYIEALAAGLPVITTDISPNLEVDPMGRASLFFKPGDAEALAGHIVTLASEPDRTNTSARRPRDLALPFHYETIGPRFFELFKTVINERNSIGKRQ